MASVNGKLVICDRCGEQVFLKCTGEGETDGGYTRWNNFEAPPEGWGSVEIPRYDSARTDYIRTCPKCTHLWRTVLNEHFLRGTLYHETAYEE